MGKYSEFERKPRDFYRTPEAAVLPLLPHLPRGPFSYAEPCAGDGYLVHHLQKHTEGVCVMASDIHPMKDWISARDAFSHDRHTMKHPEFIVTNPPYERNLLVELIPHLSSIAPTWLLLRSDFLFNKYASQFMSKMVKVVAVGRVSWEENGVTGKENHAWIQFSNYKSEPTRFVGRM